MVRLPTTLLAACGLLAQKALGALEIDLDDIGSCTYAFLLHMTTSYISS